MGKMPDIDPKALYTVEQAAEMLMQVKPGISFEVAHAEVCAAIQAGKLRVAGHLVRSS